MHTETDSPFPRYLLPGTRLRHVTGLGGLHDGDCMELLARVVDGSIDCVFADPPFNIGKTYGQSYTDSMTESAYLDWCRAWLAECVRVLAPGGTLFVYNIPRWNIRIGSWLMDAGLDFRHDIAIRMAAGFKISNKLYPAHYSLLYFTKGRPKTFRSIRTPIETCRHCGGEIKDYGGYRDRMHPDGVNLTDVWTDIAPVRHRKFKTEGRAANALSTKLVERAIEIATAPGDVVLDPFGGSGTTYVVCENRHRHWLGAVIDFADAIVARLGSDDVQGHRNDDVVEA